MRAAILCPGTSLPDHLRAVPLVNYDWTIGVNRAAVAVPHIDIWSFSDQYTATDLAGSPWQHSPSMLGQLAAMTDRPLLHTTSGASKWLHQNRASDYQRFDTMVMEEVESESPIPASLNWQRFTATRAVILAAYLGAKIVAVYGAACQGITDWDGYKHHRQQRKADRWAQEQDLWRRLAVTCEGLGIRLTRIGVDAC